MKTVYKDNIWLPGFFENLFMENDLDGNNNWETFSNPAVNIIENLPYFVVELAVPGLRKEDFSIEVEENTLIVSSARPESEESGDKVDVQDSKILKKEFNYGRFKRRFKLPENIEIEKIQANYENGVLTVTLPKLEEKKVLKRMVEIS